MERRTADLLFEQPGKIQLVVESHRIGDFPYCVLLLHEHIDGTVDSLLYHVLQRRNAERLCEQVGKIRCVQIDDFGEV